MTWWIFFQNIKITNHLDPHTQKTTRKEKHRTRGILHRFCFDTLYSNEDQISKSIALTCPYPKDLTKLKLNKCCSPGEVYSEEGCVADTDKNTSVESLLLINGFSVQDSLKENSITYNKSKVKILESKKYIFFLFRGRGITSEIYTIALNSLLVIFSKFF